MSKHQIKVSKISILLETVFAYRWVIGLAFLIAAVLFELSGSSIGMWDFYAPDKSNPDNGVILGVNRPIRSDEWTVFTPMTLTQYHNDFALKSDILRGTETDVYIVYGQPVRDWSIIFRPFQIGYLFLSPAKGLSFYWYGKLIVLFLISLEFGLLITEKDKLLSTVYAFMVSLAPVVQWWFSTNAFPDMLVYGQAIVLCTAGYVKTSSYRKRMLYAACLFLLSGAYLLVLYPSWQIPFFYVFLVICLWVVISNRETTYFEWKKDIPVITVALLALCLSIGMIVLRSWDTIQMVMNSAYPGHRAETGGIGISALFQYAGNPFLPFKAEGVPGNQCEAALFFDCFPLGIVAAILNRRHCENHDGLIICLLGLLIFLGLYVILGFPMILSRILLLSNSHGGRSLVALSFVNLLLLIRSAALMKDSETGLNNKKVWFWSLCFSVLFTYYSYRWIYRDYYSIRMFFICIILLTCICLSYFSWRKGFCILMILFSIVIGGTVNPIRSGLKFLERNTLGKAAVTLAEQSSGKWVVVSDHWVRGNFLIMYGVPVLNCTNTYVNTELWAILDPDKQCEELYNRYAHIIIELTNTDQTQIQVPFPDQIHIVTNAETLEKAGVRYLVSEKDLTIYSNESISIEPVFNSPDVNYTIFSLGKA